MSKMCLQICHYCDQNCQRMAWASYHKKECVLIRRILAYDNYINDMERLKIRIIVKLTFFNGHEEFENLPNGQRVFFKDLMSNVDQVRSTFPHNMICESNWNNFKRAMGKDQSPSLEEVQEIYGKILTNNMMREIMFEQMEQE